MPEDHTKPLRLDHFMGQALTHYYDTRDPLGVDGDFTTAPETSQLFGEIIGIWAVQQWTALGSPAQFNLIEIGPGRGTLMCDLLRGTKHIEPFQSARSIHLVETSSTLKNKQKDALKDHNVTWHTHLNEIENTLPTIIIANEFFDALPVRQFKYTNDTWQEHYIENAVSTWKNCKNIPIKQTLLAPKAGDIFEYSEIQEEYATLIKAYHGAHLIIDYGYLQSSYGDSVQALYKHQPCAITDHVGDADLTSHIDFEWLASFFKNTKIKTQAQFLNENGILIRYQHLNSEKLQSGYHRLIRADQMGELFKVLEIFNPKP